VPYASVGVVEGGGVGIRGERELKQMPSQTQIPETSNRKCSAKHRWR